MHYISFTTKFVWTFVTIYHLYHFFGDHLQKYFLQLEHGIEILVHH